jgi:nitroreductase
MDLTTVDHLLTTTRAVRKRLDLPRPVEPEVIERCIEIALQAPTGSNLQGWHFIVVTDSAKRAALADLYRQGHIAYYQMQQEQPPQYMPHDLRALQRPRVAASSLYLREHLHQVPVHIIPCIKARMEEVPHLAALAQYESLYHASIYGSIFPAIWSLMLALRARGLGSSLTTLHLLYERQAGALLGIPEQVIQVALLPVAYCKGTDFKPATRLPARELTSWNGWGQTR